MIRPFYLCLLLLIVTGCGTLFSDSHNDIKFTSEPAGASVYFNEEVICKTPCTHSFKKAALTDKFLRLELAGYQSHKIRLRKTLAVTAVFNSVNLTSWGTDLTTGKVIEYDPRSYYVELVQKTTSGIIPRNENLARDYTIMNFSHLQNEIARGEGEHLVALALHFQISRAEFNKKVKANQKRLLAHKWPNDFYEDLETIL